MSSFFDSIPDVPSLRPASRDAPIAYPAAELVRGPGRERSLTPMSRQHTERFVVAPHRAAWGASMWSVRRAGELLAVHQSQWEAMLDASDRAYAEWSRNGVRALVMAQESDGSVVEARVFGPRRSEVRSPSLAPPDGGAAPH